ncbi:hypothetical protein GCM10022235_02110 [Kribbella ginsengisoli]|uniref:Uncharacterized protein n=1 Tax=Kribbella ginsengisoli TaxID=363865 RepID=A0ABP6VM96_9ACTN
MDGTIPANPPVPPRRARRRTATHAEPLPTAPTRRGKRLPAKVTRARHSGHCLQQPNPTTSRSQPRDTTGLAKYPLGSDPSADTANHSTLVPSNHAGAASASTASLVSTP